MQIQAASLCVGTLCTRHFCSQAWDEHGSIEVVLTDGRCVRPDHPTLVYRAEATKVVQLHKLASLDIRYLQDVSRY